MNTDMIKKDKNTNFSAFKKWLEKAVLEL